jgi:small subunit ribosomal protein S6
MRRYELMLLFRPDLEDDKLQSAVEKVTRAIVNAGGTLTKVSPWGKRRMAYEIQHFREASYFLLHFDIAPSAIRDIERGMLISEEILRHLVTVLEDHGTSISEEDLVPAAVPAGESRTDGAADAVVADDAAAEGAGETAAPIAERDDEAVTNDTDSETADQAVSDETGPDQTAPDEAVSAEPEPGTDGDEQTDEAGTAVQA